MMNSETPAIATAMAWKITPLVASEASGVTETAAMPVKCSEMIASTSVAVAT
jgi:hypothetical protein